MAIARIAVFPAGTKQQYARLPEAWRWRDALLLTADAEHAQAAE